MEGNQTLSEILTDLYRTYYNLIRNIFTLVVIEGKQARGTITRMVMLMFMVSLFMSMTWLGICIMICVFLVMNGISIMLSVGCVTMLNVILIALSFIHIKVKKKDIMFSATTSQLELAINAGKDASNE